jgi:CheY-like chemotaxis protein
MDETAAAEVPAETTPADFQVVGIGASAGGLESLERRFTHLPPRHRAELIERLRPDLALVDLGLPVMSGFDLARQIRRRDGVGTRLVALSGYGQDSDVQSALEAGFDEHLTKPPDPQRLEQLLAG